VNLARNRKFLPGTVVGFLFALMVSNAVLSCPCGEVKLLSGVKESDFTAKEGLAFTKTSEYKKEFDAAISGAYQALKKHEGEKNVAVVSDIDETLLSNIPFFEKNEDYKWNDFFKWAEEGIAPSLPETAAMLAAARKQGMPVFLITGRNEKMRKGTIDNLVRNQIAYDGLYMRSDDDKREASVYKTAIRKKIEDMGYKIILNIGDQFSDLAGGNSEDCQKLPNKIYYIR
jgi:predicted secreted acid phosphatase